uniref:Uncharacterized protein n=1 Tax=Anguilla anguilla TaxID=7936 RepID=A0A0E9SKB1_ANGAN
MDLWLICEVDRKAPPPAGGEWLGSLENVSVSVRSV